MAEAAEQWKKEYLAKRKPLSYEEYLKESGTKEALRQSYERADNAYAKAKAGYGTRASSLLSRGLSGSGYGDYLDGVAYAERERAKEEAAQRAEKESRAGYAAYLEGLEKEAQDAYEEKESETLSAFRQLLDRKIVDKDAAVSFLTTLGVEEDTARVLAERNDSILHASSERRNAIVNYALTNHFRFERAYSYALANGLSEAEAKEIASISQASRDALLGNESTYKFDISKYEEFLYQNQKK